MAKQQCRISCYSSTETDADEHDIKIVGSVELQILFALIWDADLLRYF
jgi:hypothetical protein